MAIKICILSAFTFLSVLGLHSLVKADEKAITNEDVYKILEKYTIFEKPHSIMKRQFERMQLILTGFLMGDQETITTSAIEIQEDMNELVLTHFPSAEHKADERAHMWKSIAEIIQETDEMNRHIEIKEFAEAHQHFSTITVSCIRCHQAARTWGKFPEIKPLPTEVIVPKVTSTLSE